LLASGCLGVNLPPPVFDHTTQFTSLPFGDINLASQFPITQFFGDTRKSRNHIDMAQGSTGIAWNMRVNSEVRSICDGVVVAEGPETVPWNRPGTIIRCGNWYVNYSPLNEVLVQRGNNVTAGQVIALSGTDRVGISSLHIEVRFVTSRLVPERNPFFHPDPSSDQCTNPFPLFSPIFNTYFLNEYSRLGERLHFCTGDLRNQADIIIERNPARFGRGDCTN